MSEVDFNNDGHPISNSSFAQSSVALTNLDIYSSESKRLQKIYSKISRHILTLRERKIFLLQKIDEAITTRAQSASQLQQIQAIQAKKMEVRRLQSQGVLLKQLKKRQQAQQRLNSCIQTFKSRNKNASIEAEYTKATHLRSLIQSNLELQRELETLNEDRVLSKRKQEQTLKDIHELLLQKSELEVQINKLQGKKQQIKSYYDLSASQLLIQSRKLKEEHANMVNEVFSRHQYDDLTTNDLQRMKADEQLERELLFDQIQKLKTEMSRMQIENGRMQSSLTNSNV